MQPHDLQRTLRRLEPGGWLAAARRFAGALRSAGHEPGRLLVVGTPEHEPWHLTAHLDDAARWGGGASLEPVLVRWQVPAGAPAHLSVGIDEVHRAAGGTTVLVAAPEAPDALLERLEDARGHGATVFALHADAPSLEELAHLSLRVPDLSGLDLPARFDTASHVLCAPAPRRSRLLRRVPA